MSFEMKTELFNEFYIWLKDDGLVPRRSERLHKKKIFKNLINDDEMTLENFNDFLEHKKINDLISKKVVYNQINSTILEIKFIEKGNKYLIVTIENQIITIASNNIDEFIDRCIEK